jgi:hypothetical protein
VGERGLIKQQLNSGELRFAITGDLDHSEQGSSLYVTSTTVNAKPLLQYNKTPAELCISSSLWVQKTVDTRVLFNAYDGYCLVLFVSRISDQSCKV